MSGIVDKNGNALFSDMPETKEDQDKMFTQTIQFMFDKVLEEQDITEKLLENRARKALWNLCTRLIASNIRSAKLEASINELQTVVKRLSP